MSVNEDSGMRVLEDPLTSKGTAFTEEERSGLGLRGLVPTAVETLDQRVRRRYRAYKEQSTDIARHINLRDARLVSDGVTLSIGLALRPR